MLFAIIPIKDTRHGKSRLTPVLDQCQRRTLNEVLARHTIEVCAKYFGQQCTIVATSSDEVIALAKSIGVQVTLDPSGETSIDAAVRTATVAAKEQGAKGIVVIPSDLPLLSDACLRNVLVRLPPAHGCLLVPDRRGDGTNLLAVTPASSEVFSYGEGSLQRHADKASRLGYEVLIYESRFLTLDLDLPEDLTYFKVHASRSRRITEWMGAIIEIIGGKPVPN